MNYFEFLISTNADGSRVSYSPNWHGTMPKCPKNVAVLLYNDKEGYGIAKTEDTFIPPEVTVIKEDKAMEEIAKAEAKVLEKQDAGIWVGQKLADRWLPEAIHEDIPDTPGTLEAEAAPPRVAVDTFLKNCPICHKNVAWVVKYDDKSVKIVQNGKTIIQGLIAKEIILTCPDGHRVKVVLNG